MGLYVKLKSIFLKHYLRDNGIIENYELFFHNAFDFSPLGMCIVNLEGKFLLVNGSFEKLIDYSAEELEKFTFNDITHPEDFTIGSDILEKLVHHEIQTANI